MSDQPRLDYSIVVPVFNAGGTLRPLHAELARHLEPLGHAFEIVLVDDCSRDNSWGVITELAELDSRVRGILLMRNSGQGAATMAGLSQARGRLIVTIDDDLQNPPYEVPRLLAYLEKHPDIDVVFGRPREKQHARWRRLGSHVVNRLTNFMFGQRPDFKLTSFRVMRREVVGPLVRLNVSEPAVGALLTTLTKRLVNVDVDHHARMTGESGYSLRKLTRVTIGKFLGFSTVPLQLLASAGVIGILLSLTLGAIVLIRFFLGDITVQGWTTLTLLLIGLSGFIFLGLGIIGEYLQQILLSVRKSPMYLVRSVSDSGSPPASNTGGAEIAMMTGTGDSLPRV